MNIRYLILAGAVLSSTACVRNSQVRDVNAGSSTYDRNQLSSEELTERAASTVYDVVLALRPNWLRPPGQGRTSAAPAVYVDSRRIGGVSTLRQISASAVSSVRYLTASEAQGRYGPRAVEPAIELVSKSFGSPGGP